MPCVDSLRPAASVQRDGDGDEDTVTDATSAADIELYLPESMNAVTRNALPSSLLAKYRRLRLAQAEDALNAMKRHLRKGAALFKHKMDHTAGTGVAANTRMQAAIARQETKKRLDAERYRVARTALLVLCPSGKWKERLLPLRDSDIRPAAAEGTGEGRRVLTWIWRMRQNSGDDLEPGDNDDDANERANNGEGAESVNDDAVTVSDAEGERDVPF